jgi:hypothetical protein
MDKLTLALAAVGLVIIIGVQIATGLICHYADVAWKCCKNSWNVYDPYEVKELMREMEQDELEGLREKKHLQNKAFKDEVLRMATRGSHSCK